MSLQGKLNLYDFYNAIMQKTDNHGGSKPKVVCVVLERRTKLIMTKSIGTTKCHGAYGSGATSRISSEAERATPPQQSKNSVMGLSLLNVPPVPILGETYRPGGTPSLANGRKLLQPLCTYPLTDGSRRWLYSLFLAIDANFRLKLKTRAIKDPELGSGLSYFVDTIGFQEHLESGVNQDEVSLLTPPPPGSSLYLWSR